MGELFRSQEMQLIQLFFQVDAAHDTFDELGQLGIIEFKDLNPEVNLFQRSFVNEVKRADELERKLAFFEDQVKNSPLEEDYKALTIDPTIFVHESVTNQAIGDYESQWEDLEKEIIQMNGNQETLKRNFNELIELKHVLTREEEFFESGNDRADEDEGLWAERDGEADVNLNYQTAAKLGFVTGLVAKEKMQIFERVLWRATRGNLYMKHTEIEEEVQDPHTGEDMSKVVFVIFYQGNRAQDKIKKICESFFANLYPCPDTSNERRDLLNQVNTRLDDLKVVLERSNEQRIRVLSDIAPNLGRWMATIAKEKGIYHEMNKCNYDLGRKCLIAEGWCPTTSTDNIQTALRRANDRSDAQVPAILNVIKSKEEPPTFFKTNRFTQSFQGIVDSYGMARYGEVNPGVYTIITFPFLFGVMFGDVGHGFLLLLFSLFLVLKEKSLGKHNLNEMVLTCFNGRYLLLLMSIFSIYCGFIYNECFAVALNLFGSRWEFLEGRLDATPIKSEIAYPFGVDPAWKGAQNELVFYNSLKMKLSVIFGVGQMMFGICLSLVNAIHFKKPYNIWFEFIPQVCFMMSTFGYMCFLIFYKWCLNYANLDDQPPYLLNVMINMFLKPTNADNLLFNGQIYLQWVLILVAAVSVPMMLFPKPFLLKRDYKRKMKGYKAIASSGDADDAHKPLIEEGDRSKGNDDNEEEEEEEFDFGEVMIHQVIHTIEFVLGAISNTASYLRLWALSLAHSELATVFWSRVLVQSFEASASYSFIVVFGGFAVWAAFTFGVLLVMEALSAFLHALRLHWVEFQNKFYVGDGHAFAPFSYQHVLCDDEE